MRIVKKIYIISMAAIFSCMALSSLADPSINDYRAYAATVNAERQFSVIRHLSSFSSRMVGVEGADKAASYIENK